MILSHGRLLNHRRLHFYKYDIEPWTLIVWGLREIAFDYLWLEIWFIYAANLLNSFLLELITFQKQFTLGGRGVMKF